MTISRRLTAEFLGTAFLVAAVIGSGIMGERLAAGNVALALLANTVATGAALVALILAFGSISGAHLNPAVTLSIALENGISWLESSQYALFQILGGISGAVAAHLMFGLSPISLSHHARSGPAQFLSEFIATFGLVSVIWGCTRSRPSTTIVSNRGGATACPTSATRVALISKPAFTPAPSASWRSA